MNKQLNNIRFVFTLVMSMFYVGIGVMLLFRSGSLGNIIPAQYVPILGLLLIVYGLFRGYRAFTIERKL